MNKPKRDCLLRSTVVGTRRLIVYESLRDVLSLDTKPDDPLTITVKETCKRTGLSRATISRLMKVARPNLQREKAAPARAASLQQESIIT